MNLVVLNLQRGHNTEGILQFIAAQKEVVDIFCFQEVLDGGATELGAFWHDDTKNNYQLLDILKASLPDYVSFFHPHLGQWAGLATFVRKDIEVVQSGDEFVYKERPVLGQPLGMPPAPRNIQYIQLKHNEKMYTVVNFHGLWDKRGKIDTPERIEQSRKIIAFASSLRTPYILCGDFNLVPTNESLQMLVDELDVRNLVSEFGVSSTRSKSFSGVEKYADYLFVSNDITVNTFKVVLDEVSDHLPLYIDFV